VLQELLGHADIGITLNTYGHVLPDIKKSAGETICQLLNNLIDELSITQAENKEGGDD